MPNDHESIPKQEKTSSGKLERRQIFVSHAHADRILALEVRKLVEGSFSGLVHAYVSSDPTPTGGVKPGEGEWYSQIHRQLQASESVWVLATPTSIGHPWIYWEAGFGKAICPGSLLVLRVGVNNNDLPSPLSNFQSYDGSVAGAGGVGELVGKVGEELGMKVQPVLIEAMAEKWTAAAKSYKPETEGETPGPEISPEHLDQFGALIARLEAAVNIAQATSVPSLLRPDEPADDDADEAERRWRERQERVIGRRMTMHGDVSELAKTIDGAPRDTRFRFREIDSDGDAAIEAVAANGELATIWVRKRALGKLREPSNGSARVRTVVKEIVETISEKGGQ
jgi:hypothetical protein